MSLNWLLILVVVILGILAFLFGGFPGLEPISVLFSGVAVLLIVISVAWEIFK